MPTGETNPNEIGPSETGQSETGDRDRRINRVVEALLDLPRERWDERIRSEAGGDPDFEHRVRTRLRYLDDPDDLPAGRSDGGLGADDVAHGRRAPTADARPPATPGSADTPGDTPGDADDLDLRPGQPLGDFKLIAELGGGGMGRVWKARQEKPSRLVALKVVRPGLRAEDLRELFGFEGFVHGTLRHEGIVHVYDVREITPPGSRVPVPVIVMELVEGAEPITAWARRTGADVRTIAHTFADVCDAVQHLHTKTLVHQDLKPGNILIDVRGKPKVVDLGVCKPANSTLERSPRLRDLWRRAGTPEYMSPEKRDARLPEADTQSDVYSLGVVLWETIAGERYIEREPGASTEQRVRNAAARAPEPPSNRRPGVPADLDAITLRALAESPRERYRTAGQMGTELRRFLNHEPVQARGGGTLYHAGKFLRRHRSASIVAGVVSLSLLLVVVIAAGFLVRAQTLGERTRTAERERAEQRRITAQAQANSEAFESLIESLLEAWADPRSLAIEPEQRRLLLTTIEDGLVRLSQSVPEDASPEEIRQRRLVEADIRWRLGNFYDDQTLYEDARRQFALALTLYEQHGGPDRRTEETRRRLAQVYLSLDPPRLEEAVRLLNESIAYERERSGVGTVLAKLQTDLARALFDLGRFAEAREHARAAIGTIEAMPPEQRSAAAGLLERARDLATESNERLNALRERDPAGAPNAADAPGAGR